MDFLRITLLFVVALAAHNLEEAIWLPNWSQNSNHWFGAVGAFEFRFALVILTALAMLCAIAANIQGKMSLGAYLVSGYALAMLLNVFFPHVVASLALRRYMPGTATALLFNLPINIALLNTAIHEGYIDLDAFKISGPLVVATILGFIPILFRLGRQFEIQVQRRKL